MMWLKRAFLIIFFLAAITIIGLQWISAIQFKRGMTFYKDEDWLKAMEAFKHSSRLLTIHPEPHRWLGKTYLHLVEGRNEKTHLELLRKAEKELLLATSIEEKYPYYWSRLGRISEGIELFGVTPERSADFCYHQACILDPNNPLFLELLTKYLLRNGSKDEAREFLLKLPRIHIPRTMSVIKVWLNEGFSADELIELFENDSNVLIELANWFRVQREYQDKALSAAQRAFELDPQNPKSLKTFGIVISETGVCEELRPVINQPGLEELGRKSYASCLVRVHKDDLAEEEYIILINIRPDYAEYRWELAKIYLRKKEFIKAKEQLLWIAKNPDVKKVYFKTYSFLHLAKIFEKEGEIEKALKYYRMYLDQRPNDTRVLDKVKELQKNYHYKAKKINSPWEIRR